MAKKTRKQKQRSTARRPAAAAPARPVVGAPVRTTGTAAVDGTETPAGAEPVTATRAVNLEPATGRRRVGRVGPVAAPSSVAGRQQRPGLKSARFGTAAAMVEPLDSDDPAIPFDRVPYVPADLRRVAVIATVMVVLILIAWAIVTNVVD
jgi:hypothetical protein